MFSRRFLRIKVVKALYAHITGQAESLKAEEKNLMLSINQAHSLYHHILSLATEVKNYAAERIEIAKAKKLPTYEDLNPNYKFVNNTAIKKLEQDEQLDHLLAVKKLSWTKQPEIIKNLYQQMVEADYYKEYMASDKSSYAEDRRVVEEFFIQTVQDNAMLLEALEEQHLGWSDDLDFILIMVLRTLSATKASSTSLALLPAFKSEDDEQFTKRLFAQAIVGYEENLQTIEKYTVGWEIERIALMDNIILTTALAELKTFPEIPVKVSLDEYIEIAKYYSTLGSGNFVNGVLDKVVESFVAEGKIVKQGRGLVEI